MGLFDIFSSSPEKKIEKTKRVMLNEHHQAQVRQGAIYDLMNMEHPEAVAALVERLGVSMRDTIQNEKEQGWVHDILVDRCKERAVEPLKAYIKGNQLISKAILALKELISDEELELFLCEVLKGYDPKDHRSVDARLNLIDALHDLPSSPLEVFLPYALDHSDDVRVKVINTIRERLTQEATEATEITQEQREAATKALVGALSDPFAAGRITRAAGLTLARLELNVSAYTDQLTDLPDELYLEGGLIKAR
jgi:hypothetical protein